MAIQKSFNSEFGIEFSEAYCYIDSVQIFRIPRSMHVIVNVYANIQARQAQAKPIYISSIKVPDGQFDAMVDSSLQDKYNFIKQYPDFENGIDV